MREVGHLIVLEGPDGVGKSTLSQLLVDRLSEAGLVCQSRAFPGNEPGTLGALVYQLHHDADAIGVREITPAALQAAHIAAHLDAIERIVRPAVDAGMNIVLDRYWWSTEVYGVLGGVSRDVLAKLISAERSCWGSLEPLVVFMIDRDAPWRATDDSATWHQLAQEYRNLAARERTSGCVEVIENSIDPHRVATGMAGGVTEMIRELDDALPRLEAN